MRTPWLLGLLAILAACKGDTAVVDYNQAPSVLLTEPVDASVYEEGEPITFRGIVADDGDIADLELQWSSSLDLIIESTDLPDPQGNITMTTGNLSQGEHLITLRAFDIEGENAEAGLTVIIEDVPEAPSIQVIRPATGEQGLENSLFTFEVAVDDRQDAPENLIVHMTSSAGAECYMVPGGDGRGTCTPTTPLPAGSYLLNFQVTDTDGNTANANASFDVLSREDYDADGDGWTMRQGDCDDNNKLVYPTAPEACDGLDNDCNESTPTDGPNLPCWDDDGDGYCETGACANAAGTIPDCDDANPNAFPSTNPELPNRSDDDCDGTVDEGTVNYDDDSDGYCESGACENTTNTKQDCQDADSNAFPDNKETCDSGQVDNDCDGEWNEQNAAGCVNYYPDADGDTYGAKSGSGQCWCSPGKAPYTGTTNNDCLDTNAAVNPGQSGYFTSDRGDSKGFDYNCDGTQEKQYRGMSSGCKGDFNNFECDVGTGGWQGTEKPCGQSGPYLDSCGTDVDFICAFTCSGSGCSACITCDPEPTTRTQGCR